MKYQKYRLAKQLRNYDCAPVSIVNTMKLCGAEVSYKAAHQDLLRILNTQENKGTYLSDLQRFLKKNRFLKKKLEFVLENVYVKKIHRLIDSGMVALLAFGRGRFNSGHVCVIAGYNREGLEIVNWNKYETIQTVGFDTFKRNVLDYNEATYYFFKKENNHEVKKNNRRTIKRNNANRTRA